MAVIHYNRKVRSVKPPVSVRADPRVVSDLGITNCWLLNEGGGGPVDIVGAQAGTLAGTTGLPTWITDAPSGVAGPALSFISANSQYVNCGTPAALYGASYLSLAGWMWKGTSGDTAMFGTGATSTQRCDILWFSDGNVYFELDGGFPNAAGPSVGAWHHFAVTYQTNVSSMLVAGYIDGALVIGPTSQGASATTAAVAGQGSFRLGNASTSTRFTNGRHDVAVVANKVWSLADVQQLYRDPFCMVLPQPKRLWFIPVVVATGFIPRIIIAVSEPSSPDQGNLNLWSGKPNQPVTPRSLRQPLIIQAEDITYRELAPSTIQGGDPNKSVTPPSLRPIVLSQVESVNEILAGNSPFVSVVKSTLTAPPSPPTRALVLQQQVYPLDARAEEGYSQRWAGLPPPKPSQLLPGVVFIPQEPLAPYTGSVFLVLAPNPKNAAGVTKQAPIPLNDIYSQITTFLGRAGG